MTSMAPVRAFVRGVANTFANSLKMQPPEEAISLHLAQSQHQEYVNVLKRFLQVHVVPADDRFPDCCFIEDASIVVPDTAVISRPGALERREETEAVQKALAGSGHFTKISNIEEPGLLDGGDVLRVGSHLLAGISSRTNHAGVEQLAHHIGPGYTVQTVPVEQGLHLKSPLTSLDDHTVIYTGEAGLQLTQRMRSLPYWRDMQCIHVPDFLCANVLLLGAHVIMQGGFPHSERILQALCEERGLQLHKTPTLTEFGKADGALTCLSILC